jgi:hypothetical protein
MLYAILIGLTLPLWGLFKLNLWLALATSGTVYALVRYLSQGTERMIKVVQSGDVEGLRALLGKKWSQETLAFGLRTAAGVGRREEMRLLLEAGAPIDQQTGTRGLLVRTALMEAALRRQPEALRMLLDKGAKPNVLVDLSGHKSSALQFACLGGHRGCVAALLDAGANPNVVNSESETPLMYAAACGHIDAIKLLVDRGAEMNAKTKKRHTALDWARATMSGWGQRDVLLRAGATIDAAGLKESEAFLLSAGAKANKLPSSSS